MSCDEKVSGTSECEWVPWDHFLTTHEGKINVIYFQIFDIFEKSKNVVRPLYCYILTVSKEFGINYLNKSLETSA